MNPRSRRFQFSTGWGIARTIFGAALAYLLCDASSPQRIVATVVVAAIFGVLAWRFGGKVIELLVDLLTILP